MLRCMPHAGGAAAAVDTPLQQPLTRRRRHELQQEVADARDAASGKRAASRARCQVFPNVCCVSALATVLGDPHPACRAIAEAQPRPVADPCRTVLCACPASPGSPSSSLDFKSISICNAARGTWDPSGHQRARAPHLALCQRWASRTLQLMMCRLCHLSPWHSSTCKCMHTHMHLQPVCARSCTGTMVDHTDCAAQAPHCCSMSHSARVHPPGAQESG